jgi:Ser/Thr protein kinase RdoA (MazF antagonist)
LGVPICGYPFCRTEDGILKGDAASQYTQALERLLSYQSLDDQTRAYCSHLVERLLSAKDDSQTLVHGDLSQDHVLFDPESGRITGVIDFSDAIITTRLLDFTYLYHSYGRDFFEHLISYYPTDDRQQTTEQVRLLHAWYIALRLLWSLEHDYRPGIEANMQLLGTYANKR